jgi:hypothetical protein
MEFVAGSRRGPAEVGSVAQVMESATPSAVVVLLLADGLSEALCEEGAQRGATFGSEDLGLAKEVSIEFEGNVCFHGTQKCSARFYVQGWAKSS